MHFPPVEIVEHYIVEVFFFFRVKVSNATDFRRISLQCQSPMPRLYKSSPEKSFRN